MEKLEINNDKLSTEKTITTLYLNNLFEDLMRITMEEKLLINGCVDLKQYIEETYLSIEQVQYKNYQLIMTDIEILLNNIKDLVGETNWNKMYLQFLLIKNFELKNQGFLKTKYSEVDKSKIFQLKIEFYNIIPMITKLRGALVSSLWPLLSPSTDYTGKKKTLEV